MFKGINGDKEQLSQHEYMRGISAWNFDLEDLRKQASLNPDSEMCSSEVGDEVPKRKPMVRRSKTMSLDMFKISDKDLMMSSSNSLTYGAVLPSFHRKFLPAVGYKVGTFSEERKARRERTAESLALEEPHQPKEPLEDTKQVGTAGSGQEKQKNGYTVSPVNQASCTATEILPLLHSLLVQNDIQREKFIRLIRFFDPTAETENPISKTTQGVQIYISSRERELQSQVDFLEKSVEILVEEVKRRKEINDQLEGQIRSLTSSTSNSLP